MSHIVSERELATFEWTHWASFLKAYSTISLAQWLRSRACPLPRDSVSSESIGTGNKWTYSDILAATLASAVMGWLFRVSLWSRLRRFETVWMGCSEAWFIQSDPFSHSLLKVPDFSVLVENEATRQAWAVTCLQANPNTDASMLTCCWLHLTWWHSFPVCAWRWCSVITEWRQGDQSLWCGRNFLTDVNRWTCRINRQTDYVNWLVC